MYLRALEGYGEALGVELVKTYIPALNTMRNLGDLYSETRPDEPGAMYTKALAGYTIVRGGSSDICLSQASPRRFEYLTTAKCYGTWTCGNSESSQSLSVVSKC